MEEFSSEVFIYLQTVKNYLKTNLEARNYFLGDSDEELFYQHLCEISQKNYEKNGEVMLNKEQFELLRTTAKVITTSKKNLPEKSKKNIEENIFLDLGDFGKICLN
jgi:hypothetical protein